MEKLFITIFLITSCYGHTIAQNRNSLLELINGKYQIYIEGFKNQDASLVANLYSKNGIRAYPNGKQIVGRKAIEEDISKFLSRNGSVDVIINVKDLWIVDNFVFETGSWSYKYGKSKFSKGNYFGIWRYEKDELKFWQDVTLPSN